MDLFELSDLRTPWCIHVVATLRVAECVAAGARGITELARAVGCDAYVLGRVMNHLASKGVFVRVGPGDYAMNDAARQLLDEGVRLGLDLEGIGGRMAHAWSTLLAFTRTGVPAYDEVFGCGFWEDLEAHPEIGAQFDALMGPAGHGVPDAAVPLTGGWDAVRTVGDIGGGTGSMLAALLRAHPHLQGVLVDLPRVVERAVEMERMTVVGQSFFDPLPRGLDVYLLRGVLNDWPDRECVAILRRCAEAAGPAGRVVVMKGIVADGAARPLQIEMVLVGGKQRTVTEFREVAAQAGLGVVFHEMGSGIVAECGVVGCA